MFFAREAVVYIQLSPERLALKDLMTGQNRCRTVMPSAQSGLAVANPRVR